MNDGALDVLIAVYLIPELAKDDFDVLVGLIESKRLQANGVVLVRKDVTGQVDVSQAGDHTGKLSKLAKGALRKLVAEKIGDQVEKELPPGSASVVAVYPHAQADIVDGTLKNAIRKSTSQIDHVRAKELKAGLAAAGSGLSG